MIEAVTVTDKPTITLGDERKISGWGPLQKVQRCDIEAPSRGLPAKSYVLAESLGADATNYVINIPAGFIGQVERADGMVIPLEQLQVVHSAYVNGLSWNNQCSMLFIWENLSEGNFHTCRIGKTISRGRKGSIYAFKLYPNGT